MKTFKKYTMGKLRRPKDSTYYKRALARHFASAQGQKYKDNFDKNTISHKFKIGDKVLISSDFYTKNPKLAPKFYGPGEIIDINDTNAKVKINKKIRVLNVNKLKIFLEEECQEHDAELQDLSFQNFSSDMPLTCA